MIQTLQSELLEKFIYNDDRETTCTYIFQECYAHVHVLSHDKDGVRGLSVYCSKTVIKRKFMPREFFIKAACHPLAIFIHVSSL